MGSPFSVLHAGAFPRPVWLLLSTDRHAVIYTIHALPPPFFTPTSGTLLGIWSSFQLL